MTLDENTDIDLIALLKEGDVRAFNNLYWKYHQVIFRNILKLVKEEEIAKDLLQEVFITLWEKRNSLNNIQPLAGWLFTVSYNKAVSYLKKTLRESVTKKEFGINAHFDVDMGYNHREVQSHILEEAIQQLSPQKRKVFELCKLKGKTYEESAKEMNISKHTVKEYLSAAVANVYEYIKKHPDYLCNWSYLILLLLIDR